MASDEESIDTKSPDEKKSQHFRVLMTTIKTFGKRYGFDDDQYNLINKQLLEYVEFSDSESEEEESDVECSDSDSDKEESKNLFIRAYETNEGKQLSDEFIRSLDYLGTVDYIERLCMIKNIYIPKIFYEQDEFFETVECCMNRDDPLSKKDRKIRKQKLSKWCNMNYDGLVRGYFFCWEDNIDDSLTENVRIIFEETDIDEEYKKYYRGPPRKVLGESDSEDENDT
jgi:hypothetical protein